MDSKAASRAKMIGAFVPELWAHKIMSDWMRSMILGPNKEYPNGIRGTYARECDEAQVGRIIIRPHGKV